MSDQVFYVLCAIILYLLCGSLFWQFMLSLIKNDNLDVDPKFISGVTNDVYLQIVLVIFWIPIFTLAVIGTIHHIIVNQSKGR